MSKRQEPIHVDSLSHLNMKKKNRNSKMRNSIF